jgi:hypothetical protein
MMAAEAGLPLMAWQQYVSDVGLEVDSDTGELAYREVVVSVMRQNGKTTLVLVAMCARCLMWGREQRIAYTAQTGKDARTKFKEDHKPIIEASPLNLLVRRFYMSDGNTSMVWKNGSRISVLDNTPSAGHGKTLDLAVVDEAFADRDNDREQALLPTMATRVNPQIWNVSTAGTQESTYLLRKVEAGRAAVTAGRNTGLAYFEWAIPEDEDVDDPKVWAKRMPAYGVTIHDEYIRHARQSMTDGDFRRAIGNQWTETEERAIPAELWRIACQNGVSAQGGCYAIDARADRSAAAVAKSDGNVTQLVTAKPGVDWLAEAFSESAEKLPVVVDAHGPAAGQADRLEGAGFEIIRMDSLSVRKACARLFDHIADQRFKVRSDELLDSAVKYAGQKSTADLWSWSRDPQGGELLMAVSLAYGHASTDEPWQPMVGYA